MISRASDGQGETSAVRPSPQINVCVFLINILYL
jgi:hypothetical protein